VRTAEASGIALVAVARNDGFEIFTNPQRIREEQTAHGLVSNVLTRRHFARHR
jgi:hypothetical protein